MVTLGLSDPRAMITFPSRAELKLMLNDTKVVITAIIAATFVVLAFVGALTYLAVTGHSGEALTAALVTPVIGLLVGVLNNQSKQRADLAQVKHATNGTNSRLLDAVLPPTPTNTSISGESNG